MSKHLSRVGVVAAALVVWLGCAAAHAQTIASVAPGTVTVRAENVPIGEIMDQLARLSPLDRLELDPGWRGERVTLVAERVPIREAMYLALKASGLDFVMAGSRVIAGRTRAGSAAPNADDRRDGAERLAITVDEPPIPDPLASLEPAADDFAALVKVPAVPFNVVGDSVVVTQPGFVPFKMRPEVVRRRALINLADIP